MFDYWGIFVLSVFVVLTAFSLHQTIFKQAKKSQMGVAELLEEHFAGLIRHKHMVSLATIFILASALSSIAGNVFLSILFIDAPLLIFAFEIVYRLTPKESLSLLKKRYVEWSIRSTMIVAGLLLAYAFVDYVTGFISFAFAIILFISGLGGIEIINRIASGASQRVSITRRLNFAILFGYVVVLYFGLRYISRVLPEFESIYPLVDPGGVWLSALGYALLGVVVSLIAGFGFFVYLLIKKEDIQRSSTITYVVVVLALSGLFIGFVFGSFGGSFASKSGTANASSFIAPLALFVAGYSRFVFDVPRNLVKRLSIEEKGFVAALTLFLVFAALAEYQGQVLFGSVKAFLAEKSYVPWLGMLFGGVVLIIRKNRNDMGRLLVTMAGLATVLIISYFLLR